MTIPKSKIWERALADLRRIVPGARDFSPDEIARAAKASGKDLGTVGHAQGR